MLFVSIFTPNRSTVVETHKREPATRHLGLFAANGPLLLTITELPLGCKYGVQNNATQQIGLATISVFSNHICPVTLFGNNHHADVWMESMLLMLLHVVINHLVVRASRTLTSPFVAYVFSGECCEQTEYPSNGYWIIHLYTPSALCEHGEKSESV